MAIQDYETLIGKIRVHLDGTNQAFLDRSLGTIRQRVSQDQEGEEFTTPRSEAIPRDGTTAMPSCTYVGKASDIHFINSVHQSVRDPETPVSDVTFASNYIEPHALENSAFLKQPILFPSQKDTDQFLRVYLSTIHIAYPFISQSSLLEALLRFHSREIYQPEFRPWLAIFSKPRICISWLHISATDERYQLPGADTPRFYICNRIVLYVFPTRKGL